MSSVEKFEKLISGGGVGVHFFPIVLVDVNEHTYLFTEHHLLNTICIAICI